MRSLMMIAAFAVASLAGCAGSPAPDAMYPDADHRFSGSPLEAFTQTEKIPLEPGRHTLLISVESSDGFAISFQGPPSREPYSGVMMPSAQHGFGLFGEVSLKDLRYTTWDTQGGAWTLSFGCDGACAYTVAVDQNDTVPSLPHLPTTPKSFSVRGELDDDSAEMTFNVPIVPEDARVGMDFMADEAISFRILDAEDATVGRWNFDHVLARGWSYESRADELAPGEWTVKVACDGHCAFDIGLS